MASNKLHKHYLSTHKASNFAINILKNILKKPCFQVSFLQFPKHKFLSLLWHEIALSNFGDCLAPKYFWVFLLSLGQEQALSQEAQMVTVMSVSILNTPTFQKVPLKPL